MRKPQTIVAGLILLTAQQASAITIQFDYSSDTTGFFSQNAKNTLNAAGSFFGNLLTDSLSAIQSSGQNNFTASFNDPTTGTSRTIDHFSIAQDTIKVFVGARSLGGSTLGQGGPGGYSVSGFNPFVTEAQTRGQTSTVAGVQGATATDFSLWGGAISFNQNTNWYFDQDVSTASDLPSTNFDFYSVALHELGHVLGIGTADSWFNNISNGQFTGPEASTVFGGPVPLNPGLDHWAQGTQGTVNGVAQEAAMDPAITAGTRKVFTNLDVAALKDIGWQVAPVPVPAAVWLFVSGLFGMFTLGRKKS